VSTMRRVAAAVLTVGALGAHPVPAALAATQPSYEARLLALVNDARTSRGIRALRMADGTRTVARGWSSRMAAAGRMSHNPSLGAALAAHGSPNWRAIAENVAQGTASADRTFAMLMGSSAHRANILDRRFAFIGIGTVTGGGWYWTTMDFVDSYSGAAAAPPPRRTAPAPKRVQPRRPATRPTPRTGRPAPTKPRASRARPRPERLSDPLARLDALARDRRSTGTPAGAFVGAADVAPVVAREAAARQQPSWWLAVPTLIAVLLVSLRSTGRQRRRDRLSGR
jgi:hypothetical protein